MEPNPNPTSISPSPTPTQRPLVAVVRSSNRQGAVAEALALIAQDLPRALQPKALVLPTIGSRPATSTSSEVLSAVIDVLLQQDPEGGTLTVASAAPRAVSGFRRLRYETECWGRPVRFLDLERDSKILVQGDDRQAIASKWPGFRSALKFHRSNSPPPALRLCRTVIASNCRVTIAPCQAVAGSLSRFLQAAIPPIGQPSFNRKTDLQRLLRLCLPQLSIIEGQDGWSSRRVLAIAGTDPIAVEAVAAATLGLPSRLSTGYQQAEASGLGIADLDRIDIVGDPISTPRQRQRRALRFGNGQRVDQGQTGNPSTKSATIVKDKTATRSGGTA